MKLIDFQILTRNPLSGKEQEPNAGWVEHPRKTTGWHDSDVPLWRPEGDDKYEGVYFDFHTEPNGGIGIVSRGEAEVFSGEDGLIIRGKPETTTAVTIKNDRACADGGRAEIFFHYGAYLGLTIKVDGQPVKEVKIVGVISE